MRETKSVSQKENRNSLIKGTLSTEHTEQSILFAPRSEKYLFSQEILQDKKLALEQIEYLNDLDYDPDELEYNDSQLSSEFDSSLFLEPFSK